MKVPSVHKVALIHTAKDLPKNVERYVQEGLDQGMDESKAWAIAWSRYCKYKEPGSPHCQMNTSEYFPNQKKAGSDDQFVRGYAELFLQKIGMGWKPVRKGPDVYTASNGDSTLVLKVKPKAMFVYLEGESPILMKSGKMTGNYLKDHKFVRTYRSPKEEERSRLEEERREIEDKLFEENYGIY